MVDKKELAKLTVAQLKASLSSKGLELTGKKAELIDRLVKYDKEHPDEEKNGGETAPAEEELFEEEGAPEATPEEGLDDAAEELSQEMLQDAPEEVPEEEGDAAKEEEEGVVEEEAEQEENHAQLEEDHVGHEEQEEEYEIHEDEEGEFEPEYFDDEEVGGDAIPGEGDDDPDYVMIDEADEDEDLAEEISEEQLLESGTEKGEDADLDEIKIEVKAEEKTESAGASDKESKAVKRDVKVKTSAGKKSGPSAKKEGVKEAKKEGSKESKKEGSKETKDEKEEENPFADVPPLSDEEIKKLEQKEKEEEAKKRQEHNNDILFKVGFTYVKKALNSGLNRRSVLITPFQYSYLENAVLKESITAATEINMQTKTVTRSKEGDTEEESGGFLELRYPNNKACKEHLHKLSGALDCCEVRNMEPDFLTNHSSAILNRVERTEAFKVKYRDFILISRVELPKEESVDINSDMEDELASHFPGALNITIPRIDDVSNIRFIMVEFSSPTEAKDALKRIKEETVTVREDIKVEFDIFQSVFNREKTRVKRAQDEKKMKFLVREQLRARGRGSARGRGGTLMKGGKPYTVNIPLAPVLTIEERKDLSRRLVATHKAIDILSDVKERTKEQENNLELLMREKERIADDLRADDHQRKRRGMPHLKWKTAQESKPKKTYVGTSYRGRGRGRGRGAYASGTKRRYSESTTSPRPTRPAKVPRYSSYSESSSSSRPASLLRTTSGDRGRGRGSSRGRGREDYESRGSRYDDSSRASYGSSSGGTRSVQGRGGSDMRMNVSNSYSGSSSGSYRGDSSYHGSSNSYRGSSYRGRGGSSYSGSSRQSNQYQGSSSRYYGGSSRSGPLVDDRPSSYQDRYSSQSSSSRGGPTGGTSGSGGSNPVQLLLGLSKVLSNQIKQIQGDDEGDRRNSGPGGSRGDYYQSGNHRGSSRGGYSGGSNYY